MELLNKVEENLEAVEFDFAVEELEEVVTPGSGFGCNC